MGRHREAALEALRAWRLHIVLTIYADTPISAKGLLSDDMVRLLAHDARLKTVSDIEHRLCDPPWIFAQEHGEDVLAVLAEVDAKHRRASARRRLPVQELENIPPHSPFVSCLYLNY